MTDKIRWGILGTGNIANQFAKGLQSVQDAELVAVGSRSQQNADAFGDKYHVPRRYPTYERLAGDPDVDLVYISTPHSRHKADSMLCLEAGKGVLCEKPFAINAKETAEVINLARQKGLFLMEAMWTRFLPAIVKIRELLAQGVLGELRMLSADFGFRTSFNPKHRLFNPELGGGALLDVGIYPISLASMVFGKPNRIESLAHLGETGVDEEAAVLLGHEKGQIAICSTAIRLNTPMVACIMGTDGRIDIHSPFWVPTSFTLTRYNGNDPQVFHCPIEGNGYNYEAIECGRCLRAGQLESDVMPLDETLDLMRTLDSIRSQWGLKYPGES